MSARFRLLAAVAVILLACGAVCGQSTYFGISSIYEQELVSHQRIRITINSGGGYFPYSGMVGWRLMFSRWEIGDSDPQYEYAVFVLPARDYDLSQTFWFVRPIGLAGDWHMRIDAIDASRRPVATSGEFVHTFTAPEPLFRAVVPYAASSGYWATALAITNPEQQPVAATVHAYASDGTLISSWQIVVPGYGTTAEYLSAHLGETFQFFGNLQIEAAGPLEWVAVVSTPTDPVGLIMQGVCR